MAKRKRRKNKKLIAVGMIGLIFIGGTLCFYGVRELQKALDPGYGKIETVEVDSNKTDLNKDPDEKEAGETLTCVTFNCGDALSVLVDIGSVEVLYDTGYAETSKDISKKLSKYVDGELDYLILSHSHADHVGGTPQIAKDYRIGTVITSGEKDGSSSQFTAAEEALKKEGCEVLDDADMDFDLSGGATLSITDFLDPGDTDNPNDLSVVANVRYGKSQILITGDSEKEAENAMLGKFSDITLLVAGHHLSNTANSLLLLKEWNPEIIFASCKGKDSEYGFPHKAALQRCLSVTDEVYATFKSGDLIYTTDGDEDKINVERDQALMMGDCPQ